MQKSNPLSDILKQKQYEIAIPNQIRNAGKLTGALFFEFGETQCLTLYNNTYLYFVEISDGNVVKYSSFSIPGIKSIVSIIKGYILITTVNQTLWLLQVKKVQKTILKQQIASQNGTKIQQKGEQKQKQKSQKLLTVQSFLKQALYNSYFIREVTSNMIQLYITCPSERNNRIIYVYQFTVNQKVGGMGFTVDKNMKIICASRKQLYASKTYFDPFLNSILKLKNFSDSSFSFKKIQEEYICIFPICKTQEYYCLNKDYEIFNAEITNVKKSAREQLNGFSLQNGIFHMNYAIFQHADNKIGLFTMEEGGKIKLLGTQSKYYHWQICYNGRLVGISDNNTTVRITKQLFKKLEKSGALIQLNKGTTDLSPQANIKLEKQSISQSSKIQQKKQQKTVISHQQKKGNSQEKKQKPNKSEEMPKQEQQPQQSKIKSNFKPAKILSRKDLTKQTKETVGKKQQTVQNKLKKEPQKQSLQSKNNTEDKKYYQEKKQNKQYQIQYQIKAQKTEKTQNTHKIQKTQEQIKIIQNSPKRQKNEQTKKDSQIPPQMRSPFSKKSSAGDHAVKIAIPNISYDQIFGNQAALPPKVSAPLFSKPHSKQQYQKPTQTKQTKKPFHKKSESLVINDDGTIDIIDKQQEHQLQELQKRPRKLSARKQDNIHKSQKMQNCCNHYQQTKLSFNNFSQKIDNLQQKTISVLKSLENTTESIKNQIKQTIQNSHIQILQRSQQKVTKSLKTSVQLSMNDYFAKKLTPKVNEYFKAVMNDTKKVYDNTLKFYSDKKKQSIISLQNHFQQQQHLVNEIRLMTTDMLTCVQNTVNQGQQNHGILLKQWQKISNGLNVKLDANLQSLQNHKHDRCASQRQHILDSLSQIKDAIQTQDSKKDNKMQEIEQKTKKESKNKQKSVQSKQQKIKQKTKKKSKIVNMHDPRQYYNQYPYNPYSPYAGYYHS